MSGALYDRSIPFAEWQARRVAHHTRVRPWVEDRVHRVSRQQKHPVYDFLFEYYAFRPSYLARWSPGVGVRLEVASPCELDWAGWFHNCDGGWVLPAVEFPSHRIDFLRWAIEYLEETSGREPSFGCFGLHEWAMVYREPTVRHPRTPLRLSRADTNAVVDAGVLRCTHYDAFRFFTPAATPRNREFLDRESAKAHDQPGCLHVGMDLYKWAFVIAPYSSSELVAEAFELAVAARELDMRASPYDLRSLGFESIPIESREGREEYMAGQRNLYARGQVVRSNVLVEYRRLLDWVQGTGTMQT